MKLKKMNKRGEMVLRDIIMIMIIFSGIIALSSVFVSNMATTYNNTNMSSSYNQDSIGENRLSNTTSVWTEIAEDLNGNLLEMLSGTYKAAKAILTEVIKAPATFVNMMMSVLEDLGVDGQLLQILDWILTAMLYIIIVFVVISAFLQGGKM